MRTDDVARSIDTDTGTEWYALHCGPLAMHFDPTIVALRNIRMGDHEVVHAISVAVRDRNWGTVAPQITEVSLIVAHGGFRLAFVAVCREREIDFRWQGHIVGEPNGSLRFDMDGEAQSTFWRNRIGFCVLHPIRECAGAPCIVTTADGAAQQGVFPDLIAPHQPFLNMRGIRHEVLPGVWAELSFDGDIFEMEDQRNWTDASYKTYCTPLSLPYPVEVSQGTRIAQSVTLTLNGELPSLLASDEHNDPVTLSLTGAPLMPLPQIGLGIASHGARLSEREREILTTLHLTHLRLDLDLNASDWEARFQRAAYDAASIDAKLEIALFLADNGMEARLAVLAEQIKRLRPNVVRWLIFHADEKTTPERCLRAARKALAPLTPEAPFGGGTNAYFAELNRNRPPQHVLDCVCWSINPQVHACDSASIMENLEAQVETVRSARAIYGNTPIVISPITLKPRFNPNATAPEGPPLPGELPPQVDARQCTLIGAVWTLISLKHLCASGIQSVTYYETTGWRGVMAAEAGSAELECCPVQPGMLFPAGFLLAAIGEFAVRSGASISVAPLASTVPAKVDGLLLCGEGTQAPKRLLMANLTPHRQKLRLLLSTHNCPVDLWQLEAESVVYDRVVMVQQGILERELPPYALLNLDWE